ncbi:GDSL family lipase [Trinickia symbiotica]|uniref:GDSL family lipase n=2 Tax=Trinickia symbiotica TaxID=863227 RepID=A0A2T3XLH8_9BURK|nr:SGNH/GDSL hydrolase family protein [Trinickia symbiotica]PTB17372.1 GDSL family lipase [Trinickia symbiotica]
MGNRLRLWAGFIGILLGAFAMPCASAAAGAPTAAAEQWVASWATALQAIPELRDPPPLYRAPDVSDRTVREIVYPTLSGRRVRVTISNAYGRAPLAIDDVVMAQSAGGAAVRPATAVQLTFAGRTSIVLEPGDEVETDAAEMELHAGEAYAISVHARRGQTMTAWHRVANQINYVSSPGDHAADAEGSAYTSRFTEHAWVTAISVPRESSAAIAAIGDSITDGLRSSLNENRRWPDALTRRLAGAGGASTAVLDLGISGNRLLSDSACYGEALERRFAHDALGPAGVKAVIVLIGINDINFATMPRRSGLDCDAPHTVVTAQDLIEGYRRLIDAAHRRGVRVFGATLTPAAAPPAREAIRLAVNTWIRTSGAFDGVIDFDAALRNPANADRLRRDYDSGDGIHPNDSGYEAMGAAIDLAALTSAAHRH